jgi:hypothetical protein
LDGLFCPLFSIEPANSSLPKMSLYIGYGSANAEEQLMINLSSTPTTEWLRPVSGSQTWAP